MGLIARKTFTGWLRFLLPYTSQRFTGMHESQIMSKSPSKPGRLHSDCAADAAWRSQQAHVDADIEGLPRNQETDRLLATWAAEGLTIERKIERIKAYYAARQLAKADVA